jgi:hypothetical protein
MCFGLNFQCVRLLIKKDGKIGVVIDFVELANLLNQR